MASTKKSVAQLELVDGVPVIEVTGEVDIANIGELDESLRSAGEYDAGAVVVSLEKASYFDSAAIHALIMCRARLSTSRQGFVIVQPATAAGRRILEIAGLMREDMVAASLAEAVERAKLFAAQRRAV